MRSRFVSKRTAVFSVLVVGSTLCLEIGGVEGCGSSDDSTFGDGNGMDGGGLGDGGGNVTGESGGFASSDSGTHCTAGLCTQAVDCTGQGTGDTTISGVVTDPAGKNPLYNILVYIPNFPAQVPAYVDGPSCDLCGTAIPGGVAASAVTDIHGAFNLTHVPVGANIPVIVQVGKWRRAYTFSNVDKCVANAAPSNDVYRLPRNSGEGHIPKMAIVVGGADSLECMLRRMGLEDPEFEPGGRVTLYAARDDIPDGHRPTKAYAADAGGTAFPDGRAFWNDPAQINKQDIVIYSCEGTAYDSDKDAGIPNTADFLNHGGKMFASHWHRGFFSLDPKLSTIGTWSDLATNDINAPGNVVTSFPKGKALADWLVTVDASAVSGELDIKGGKENVYDIVSPGTEWIYLPDAGTAQPHAPQFVTVDTPVGAPDSQICGKAAFTDLHVSSAGSGDQAGNNYPPWPTECANGDLTPQEKALEFLFFDLSACVQNDSKPPPPPR